MLSVGPKMEPETDPKSDLVCFFGRSTDTWEMLWDNQTKCFAKMMLEDKVLKMGISETIITYTGIS